ncbi:hypothetical protein [Enterococcus sp. LJL51]|uniref:hypothetical protein n=1 Tax=Enterococcus sp. LJL51 TaxID=3416656 RepID=UPI003CF3C9B7
MKRIWKARKKVIILSGLVLIGICLAVGIYLEQEHRLEQEPDMGFSTEIRQSDKTLENETLIYSAKGYMGLMDENGKILLNGVEEKITEIESIPNSKLFACQDENYKSFYYISGTNERLEGDYSISKSAFSKGEYGAYRDTAINRLGIIKNNGEIIKAARDMKFEQVKSIYFETSYLATIHFTDGKSAVLNYKGELLTERFEDLYINSSDNPKVKGAIVQINDEEGILHCEKGWTLTPVNAREKKIEDIYSYRDNTVAKYYTTDNQNGLIDENGEIIKTEDGSPLLFQSIGTFSSAGIATARSEFGEELIIDKTGKILMTGEEIEENELGSIYDFDKDGYALSYYRDKEFNRSYVLIDENLKKAAVLDSDMDDYTYLGFGLLSAREVGNGSKSYALVNIDGDILLSQEEAEKRKIHGITRFENSNFATIYNKAYDNGLIDKNGKVLYTIKKDRSITLEKILNSWRVTLYKEGINGTNKKLYTNKDGECFYEENEDQPIFIGKDILMIVNSVGITEVFDQDGYLIDKIAVKE